MGKVEGFLTILRKQKVKDSASPANHNTNANHAAPNGTKKSGGQLKAEAAQIERELESRAQKVQNPLLEYEIARRSYHGDINKLAEVGIDEEFDEEDEEDEEGGIGRMGDDEVNELDDEGRKRSFSSRSIESEFDDDGLDAEGVPGTRHVSFQDNYLNPYSSNNPEDPPQGKLRKGGLSRSEPNMHLSVNGEKRSFDRGGLTPGHWSITSSSESIAMPQSASQNRLSGIPEGEESNDHEKKAAQLKLDIEHAGSIVLDLENRLRQLLIAHDEKGHSPSEDNADYVQEIRKLREEIRGWELKQWKLCERLDRVNDKEGSSKNELREYDEQNNIKKVVNLTAGKKLVHAGTMDILVELLFDDTNSDLEYVDDFLLTYRLYMKPFELLQRIISCFERIENKDGSILRVVLVLKKWIERRWAIDFEAEGLQEPFCTFFKTLIPYLKKLGKESGEFDLISVSKIFSANHKVEITRTGDRKRLTSQHSLLDTDESGSFLKLSQNPEVIAMALATKELELYMAVKSEEFVEKLLWKESDGPNTKSANLLNLINWVNQIGFWLGNEICLNDHLKNRTKALARYIEIAKECVKLGCFNSVFAIVTALNNSSILRLKKTWALLPKKTQATFKELEELCSPQFNYKIFRSLEAQAKPPFIPFFGLHLKDFLFMNDGKPSEISKNLMSFSKLRTMAIAIRDLLKFQKLTFYPFPPNPRMDEYTKFIMTMKTLEDRHLYKLSCLCEPPTWKKKSFFVLTKERSEM